MDDAGADEYLARFGADRSTPLAELQRRHLEHVPFENLDIHLGDAIDLGEDALFDKIVRRRRGGFCYELNGLFALLLEALGADVDRVGARVWGSNGFGPPLDHMHLLVTWPGSPQRWLVDVGFGRFTHRPLRWDDGALQHDEAGTFRIAPADDDVGCFDVWSGDDRQYRTDPRALSLTDFEPTCWFQQTSPASHFREGPMCSRLDGSGRVTIAGRSLIRTRDGARTETTLDTDAAVLDAYREHFGLSLPRVPSLADRGPA
jgi:N-hydroxyarylamine O-acetyltransferase